MQRLTAVTFQIEGWNKGNEDVLPAKVVCGSNFSMVLFEILPQSREKQIQTALLRLTSKKQKVLAAFMHWRGLKGCNLHKIGIYGRCRYHPTVSERMFVSV